MTKNSCNNAHDRLLAFFLLRCLRDSLVDLRIERNPYWHQFGFIDDLFDLFWIKGNSP